MHAVMPAESTPQGDAAGGEGRSRVASRPLQPSRAARGCREASASPPSYHRATLSGLPNLNLNVAATIGRAYKRFVRAFPRRRQVIDL